MNGDHRLRRSELWSCVPQTPLISFTSVSSLNSEIILTSLPVLHFTRPYACIHGIAFKADEDDEN